MWYSNDVGESNNDTAVNVGVVVAMTARSDGDVNDDGGESVAGGNGHVSEGCAAAALRAEARAAPDPHGPLLP